jgi:hypothetical protein
MTFLGDNVVRVVHLKDETLSHFYENIRTQVEAERHLPHKFVAGESVKQYAASLLEELNRRQLQHDPIEWHSNR